MFHNRLTRMKALPYTRMNMRGGKENIYLSRSTSKLKILA